jgi:GR25 family glycosyltransferase involved in LPS biosynthesis
MANSAHQQNHLNKQDNVRRKLPTYVINLDDNPERMQHMREELGKYPELQYTRIRGIHGVKDKVPDEDISPLARYLASPGTIGCFLSHRLAWQKVIDDGVDMAIIMEDDCTLVPAFYNKVTQLLDEVKEKRIPWDMVYLGHIAVNDSLYPMNEIVKFYLNLQGVPAKPYYYEGVSFCTSEFALGLHCYAITKKAAALLLKQFPQAHFHVDVEVLRVHDKLVALVAKESLANQASNSLNSNICVCPFPSFLNKTVDHIKCSSNISLTYYLTTPVAQIAGIHVNGWNIALLLVLVFLKEIQNPLFLVLTLILFVYLVFEFTQNQNVTSATFLVMTSLVLRSKYLIKRT